MQLLAEIFLGFDKSSFTFFCFNLNFKCFLKRESFSLLGILLLFFFLKLIPNFSRVKLFNFFSLNLRDD